MKYQNILTEKFHFLLVKFSVYLNRRVFVMLDFSDYTCFSMMFQKRGSRPLCGPHIYL